jgi:hypothetical protein
LSNSKGVTDRSLLMLAIVDATKKVWQASARIEREQEAKYLKELASLITEYQHAYHTPERT